MAPYMYDALTYSHPTMVSQVAQQTSSHVCRPVVSEHIVNSTDRRKLYDDGALERIVLCICMPLALVAVTGVHPSTYL